MLADRISEREYWRRRAAEIGRLIGEEWTDPRMLMAPSPDDDEVTTVERDRLPEAYEFRKGVPQGRHAHGLLARGREVLEQLFPGFTDELLAQGALTGDRRQ